MFFAPEGVRSSGSRSLCWVPLRGRRQGAARPRRTAQPCPWKEAAAEEGFSGGGCRPDDEFVAQTQKQKNKS